MKLVGCYSFPIGFTRYRRLRSPLGPTVSESCWRLVCTAFVTVNRNDQANLESGVLLCILPDNNTKIDDPLPTVHSAIASIQGKVAERAWQLETHAIFIA